MSDNHHLIVQDETIFGLTPGRSPADFRLKSLEWAIVTQVDGKKTVGEIAEALALTPAETERYFTHLHDLGLLNIVGGPAPPEAVSHDLVEELEYQLTYTIGPIATIILDEYLSDLKCKRETLDKKHLAVLVEWVSEEIARPEKRLEFQKKMLQQILAVSAKRPEGS